MIFFKCPFFTLCVFLFALFLENCALFCSTNGTQTNSGVCAETLKCFSWEETQNITFNVNVTTVPADNQNNTLIEISLRNNHLVKFDLNPISARFNCVSILDISNNALKKFPLIENCVNEISLSENNITEINNVCTSKDRKKCDDQNCNCKQMRKLRLDRNQIKIIHRDAFNFTVELIELDLSHNKLESLNESWFEKLAKLEKLSLAYNNLKSLNDEFFVLHNLRELNLENNQLANIDKNAFHELTNIEVINLSSNLIEFSSNRSYIYHPKDYNGPVRTDHQYNWLKDLAEKAGRRYSPPIKVNLSRNKIEGIRLYPFFYIYEKFYEEKNTNWIKIDLEENPLNCECQSYDIIRYLQNQTNRAPARLRDLIRFQDDLQCVEPPNNKYHLLKCINISDNVCNVTGSECPESCTCKFKMKTDSAVIDCENKGIEHIESHFSMTYQTHVYIYLKNNSIRSLNKLLRREADRLNIAILSLSYNQLESLPQNWNITPLEVLELDHNNLTTLHIDRNLAKIENISLGHNPWFCEYNENGKALYEFVKKYRKQIIDINDVKCFNSNTEVINLAYSNFHFFYHEYHRIILTSMYLSLLCVLIIMIFYYKKKLTRKIIRILTNHYPNNKEEPELTKFEYDAFISYADSDEWFVIRHLVPELEQGCNSFSICIHFRNFAPGTFITDEIIKSVTLSRRTVIVLSHNYLESFLGTFEFQTAFFKMVVQRNHKIIVILLTEVDLKHPNLSFTLKEYLLTQTYLKWGEPNFWEKLKKSLR